MLFSKCLRAKIYCNMNGHFDPQGCQTLLLKESELLFLSLGSWTINTRMIVQGQLVKSTVCLSDLLACEELIHSFIRQKPTYIMLTQQTFFNINFMNQTCQFMIFTLTI